MGGAVELKILSGWSHITWGDELIEIAQPTTGFIISPLYITDTNNTFFFFFNLWIIVLFKKLVKTQNWCMKLVQAISQAQLA